MNAQGAIPEKRRGRPPGSVWTPPRVTQLLDLLAAGNSFDQAGAAMDISRNVVAGVIFRLRQAGDPRVARLALRRGGRAKGKSDLGYNRSLRRFGSIRADGTGKVIGPRHRAALHAEPLFAGQVKSARDVRNVLVEGKNNRKIGGVIMKGARRGWPIFTVTLPERATCPRSCAAWTACYGNGMRWAIRIKADADFEDRLWHELAIKNYRHRSGFLVRLHVLGDFYSEDYVELWRRALGAFDGLHVFGFTARDPDCDGIGSALWHLATDYWDRFTMRFSGMAGPDKASRLTEPGQSDPHAIACPQQRGATECCATCALCFTPGFDRSISFTRH